MLSSTILSGKPNHGKFFFHHLDETQYRIQALNYSRGKAGGYCCVYCWASGNGVLDIIKNISKGQLINYAKRKLYCVIITAYVYTILSTTLVFTKATKFVGATKTMHSTSAYCFECVEDSTNLASLPLNLALFGQPMNYFVFQIQHSHLFILHFIQLNVYHRYSDYQTLSQVFKDPIRKHPNISLDLRY